MKNRSTKILTAAFVGLAAALLVGCAIFDLHKITEAATLGEKKEELKIIDQELQSLDTKIKQRQNQRFTLQNEIDLLDLQIIKAEKEIKKLESEIDELETRVFSYNIEISKGVFELSKQRILLAESFKELYSVERNSVIEVLLSADGFSGFMNQIKGLTRSQEKVAEYSDKIVEIRDNLESKRAESQTRSGELAAIASTLEEKNNQLALLRLEKEQALKLVNQGLNEEKAELALNSYKKERIKNEIFRLEKSNVQLDFNEAARIATRAGDLTNVRPALILAVLKQESNFRSHAGAGRWDVDMMPSHREAFLRITAKLGLDPDQMPVSKKPTNYSGWGGAMGAGQIMPKKWESVEGEIARLSGHNPPSPWDIEDAFIGTAVILRDLRATSLSGEFEACGRYFAGNNWQNYLWYPTQVMQKASIYETKLEAL